LKRLVPRLIVLISVALLPVLGFQGYAEYVARQARQQLVEAEALRVLRVVTSEQSRVVDGAKQVLNAVASTPAVQDDRRPQCHRILANLLAQSPRYEGIGVVGLDGELRCAARPFTPPINLADRFYFREALRTGGFVVGKYTLDRNSGAQTVQVARPFRNAAGAVEGVVLVSVNLGWLGEQLGQLGLPHSAISVVTDRDGTILARYPAEPGGIGRPSRGATRLALAADKAGVVETTSRDGKRRFAAYSPPAAEPKGLGIVVGLDRDAAFSAAAQANRTGLALILAGAALAVLITLVLGAHLIRRPFHRLLAAAEQWRGGDLSARSGVAADASEFGRLGAAFDAMAAALAEREQALSRALEKLAQSNADLEARVREAVAARQAAQAEAAHAESLRTLGQLAGGIAHDFNNILQAVEGAAALIERRPTDALGVHRMVRLAREAVGRGASITRRLLAFGRRDALRAEPLEVAGTLAGIQEILAHTLGAAIAVEVRVVDDAGRLLADKGQLETALVNLATNARDAMPNGGRLTLVARREVVGEGAVHPAGLAAGHYVRLTIADDGAGMDAESLRRATEPFFTTKPSGAGTGLGLSMVAEFAKQSGGALALASEPGEGTTATLWLAAAEPASLAETAAVAAPDASGPPRAARLLLVDDEALLREVLAEQLADAGYEIAVAATGDEALGLLKGGAAVDVLVTDLCMPGMDGIALIREARRNRPGLPAILLTGYAGDAVSAGGEIAAPFALMQKPVRLDQLTSRLQSLLAKGQGTLSRAAE
jgi:signal transduction histidine kinase/ActR/RegA family two-component response regulator